MNDIELIVAHWVEETCPCVISPEDVTRTESELAAYLFNLFGIEFRVKVVKHGINEFNFEIMPKITL